MECEARSTKGAGRRGKLPASCCLLLPCLLLASCFALLSGVPTQAQSLNVASPLAQDLLAWFPVTPLSYGGPLWYDYVSGRSGTLTNMGSGSGWTPGTRPGSAGFLQCDGLDDVVDFGDQPLYDFPDTTFTVSLWFFTTTSGVKQYIVSKRQVSGIGWFVRIETANTLLANLRTSAANVAEVVSTQTVTDGLWHHVLVVFSTSTTIATLNSITLYLDNQLVGTQAGTTLTYTAPTGAPLSVCAYTNSEFLLGGVDDLRLWAGDKSAEGQRQATFTLGFPTFGDLLAEPSRARALVAGRPARHRVLTTQ